MHASDPSFGPMTRQEPIESEIVVKTPFLGVVINLLSVGGLIAFLLACLLVAPGDISPGVRMTAIAAIGLFAIMAADQIQRAYRFTPASIETRYLGVWRSRELPPAVLLLSGPKGDLLIWDASETGSFHYRVRCGWTQSGRLKERLETFYRNWMRLGEGAS